MQLERLKLIFAFYDGQKRCYVTSITKSMAGLAVDQASHAKEGDLARFDRVKNPDRAELRKIQRISNHFF